MKTIFQNLDDVLQTIIKMSDLDDLFVLGDIENRTEPEAPNVKLNVSKNNIYNIGSFEVYYSSRGRFKFRICAGEDNMNENLKGALENINGCINDAISYIDYGEKLNENMGIKEAINIEKYIAIAKEVKNVLTDFQKGNI